MDIINFLIDKILSFKFHKNHTFGLTIRSKSNIKGMQGGVEILCSVIKRNNFKEVIDILNKTNPHAFYTIENIRSAEEGVFPLIKKKPFDVPFRKYRKSK